MPPGVPPDYPIADPADRPVRRGPGGAARARRPARPPRPRRRGMRRPTGSPSPRFRRPAPGGGRLDLLPDRRRERLEPRPVDDHQRLERRRQPVHGHAVAPGQAVAGALADGGLDEQRCGVAALTAPTAVAGDHPAPQRGAPDHLASREGPEQGAEVGDRPEPAGAAGRGGVVAPEPAVGALRRAGGPPGVRHGRDEARGAPAVLEEPAPPPDDGTGDVRDRAQRHGTATVPALARTEWPRARPPPARETDGATRLRASRARAPRGRGPGRVRGSRGAPR